MASLVTAVNLRQHYLVTGKVMITQLFTANWQIWLENDHQGALRLGRVLPARSLGQLT